MDRVAREVFGSHVKSMLMSSLLLLTAVLSASAAEVSFLSYNIRHGMTDAGYSLDTAVRTIRAAKADFVGLQDVDWHTHRTGRADQAVELGTRCGYHATFAKAHFLGETPDEQTGVALLSHELPLGKEIVDLPGREVALFCEFADCYVGVVELPADAKARTAAARLVDGTVKRLSAKKPVFLVDETGGQRANEQSLVRRTVADPVLPAPAIVPRPTSCEVCPGIFSIGEKDLDLSCLRRRDDPSVPAEGYRLEISTEGISVISSDAAGAFYALQTLKQLAVPRWGRLYVPCCRIVDAPRFGWRGMMIDDVRHFFGKEAMKRTLELMAFHKMNVLHWHLGDDEGCRVPVAEFPKLAATVRPRSAKMADRIESGDYGPFAYTEADIREIVGFAKARHIRIVPEIDMPGHSGAALRAYPEFLCFPDGTDAPKGAVRNAFCLGNDAAIAFMKSELDSLCDLFPDAELIHIGGDEVNAVNWKACPRCRARMKAVGAETTGALQAWLTDELTAHLAKRGRRVVGWDEIILRDRAPKKATVMSWRGAEGGIAAAKAGLTCVMAPHLFCYFNYEQGLRDDPVVYPWWSYPITLEKAYSFDPLAGIPDGAQGCVLGGECCLWSNRIPEEMQLQWQTWPRAAATAEVLWSAEGDRDFTDFRRRMVVHRPRLIGRHVMCAPLD